MNAIQIMTRVALSVVFSLSTLAMNPTPSFARTLPAPVLENIFDDLKTRSDEVLNGVPKSEDDCKKKGKALKKLIRKLTKLKRKIRDRTTELRQNPDVKGKTPEIVRLQNKIKELNQLRKNLQKARKDLKRKVCPAVVVPVPVAQTLTNEALGLIVGAKNLFKLLEDDSDMSAEQKDELHTWLDGMNGNLYEKLAQINKLIAELSEMEQTEEVSVGIELLQDAKAKLEMVIELMQEALEATRTDF